MEKCSPTLGQCDNTDGARHLAQFQPDLWGDTFLAFTLPHEETEKQRKDEVEVLKELVKKELVANDKDPKETLVYIDAIQRLGVAYHFEEEIQVILQNFFNSIQYDDSYSNDLHYVSLRFRILREHGFRVSSDVFSKFKNEGNVKDTYRSDVKGILSYYEASQLKLRGENELDEALSYTSGLLSSFATDPNCCMASQVSHALKLPLFKHTPRLESTYQIKLYESNPSRDDTLLNLAKLDFNLLQVLHIKELQDITRWSESIGFSTKLPPFSRDRLVEAYFWTLGAYYEPKYSRARIILNKLFKIISITDDIYDAYGTFPELQLFTDAIQRWDKSCGNLLPDYMKFFYEVVLDTFEEIEKELANEGRSYAVNYLRKEMKASCEAYMQEAKWCHEGYVPTFEEYMKNGIVSGGYYYLNAAAFTGMGEVANKDAFEWIQETTKAVKASCVLARVVNDIGTRKFERNRGHVASAVECYIRQFGVTQEEAHERLALMAEDAWMDIKEDMLRPTTVPMPILTRVLNLSRALHDIYNVDEDGYTMNHFLKPKIEAILVTPMI
ncbi:hypothetical protein RND81_12G190100 [Saponaria officinalis]|uniref:Uncharacterized protein n=1 Tax=Saponaria officinalis TaxID=3572 RepID=A0AAW1HCJ5_SAPOF